VWAEKKMEGRVEGREVGNGGERREGEGEEERGLEE